MTMYLVLFILCVIATAESLMVIMHFRKNGFSVSFFALIGVVGIAGFLSSITFLFRVIGVDMPVFTDFVRIFIWVAIILVLTGILFYSKKGKHE